MVNSVLQSISVGPRSQLYATDELSSIQDALGSGEWPKQSKKYETHLNNTASRSCAASGPPFSPRPVTPLEASRNFFPESYTVDTQVPISCLMVISSYEQTIRADSKTNFYRLLYLKSFRHWHWLTISIQVPYSSQYWAATQTTQQDNCRKWQTVNCASAALLPYLLLKKIQAFLYQKGSVNDDTITYLSLSDRDTIERRPQISHINTLSTSSRLLSAASNALTYLHDLGCRRYDESEFVQIQMVDPSNCFCSSLNGTLVHETKFTSPTPNVEFLYAIRVLRCMNGAPGFTKLIDIITDDSRKYLKSYLIELPRARWSLVQIAANPSISWECRERWAVQLVQSINQMHAHSFVVGGLTLWTVPVIDNTDSVLFWSFKEKFVTGRTIGAYYPPEFRYARNISPTVNEADCPHITSKTDIFYLGLLL